MNKVVLLVAVAASLAVGASLGVLLPRWLPAAGGPPAEASTPSATVQAAVRVVTTRVESVPFPRGISAVGSLRSDESVVLRPEVSGRIREIAFKEGQPVAQGQVLVRLDDSIPRAEFEQARANLALAESHYRRAVDLQGRGFVSQQARDEAASELKVQRAAASLAQARLDKMTLRAPFAGVVGLRNVSVGDYVSEGQDLAPLEAIDPLKVDFRVPELYLSRLAVGQRLTLRLDALPGHTRPGEVYAVSPLVDAGGRSVLLRATAANADGVLRPGMFARVQLQFNVEQALVVPETALSPAGEAQYIFVVRDGVARRVAVGVGERRDGRVELLNGVQAGDEVIVSGLQRVSDGAPVTVVES